MSNLLATMSLATGALAAEQSALTETANNVANVNTPGYSRKQPQFGENPPIVLGQLTFGTGVSLENAASIRDPILQIRIQQETGTQGELSAFVNAMQQVQTQFNNQGNDIGTQLSALFASISQLSTSPASIALRQGVLTAASNLASSISTTANNLESQQANLDLSVTQSVDQVNTLTQQIAKVNGQIAALENLHQDASAFIDQRDVLVGQLSNLIDVSQIKTESQISLTTSNGTALVAGTQAFTLTTQPDPSGLEHIFSQGNDVTSQLNSGQLGGLLQIRDHKIPSLLVSLNTLAAGISNSFNAANASGFDLNGHQGADIFVPPAASGAGAAAGMAVAITDPALIAASSDGSAGSNGNLANFSAIHDQTTFNGETPSDFYGSLIFSIGNDVSSGSIEQQASQLVLQQLQDQRGSISGVSLDEEAGNLVQYQRAYDAAARVVDTVNQMLETLINMGTT
jgi:flagellar hook-associated protein 1 FlgK